MVLNLLAIGLAMDLDCCGGRHRRGGQAVQPGEQRDQQEFAIQ
jgi:hypothetical protein